jgi:ethanolamine ammonia-lyase small subunit
MSDLLTDSESRHVSSIALPETAPALSARLRSLTPARVAMQRAGNSAATSEVLDFQLAHGRARDAVHAPLQPASLATALRSLATGDATAGLIPPIGPLLLNSQAADRRTYLQRPDFGRRLNDASREQLRAAVEPAGQRYDLAIVLADGLSALAVERHAVPLLAALFRLLAPSALRIAPLCIVQQARVAIGDEIAAAFSASLVIVLIGERPGLTSPDSLGAYITWDPQPGRTTDAERNCISNIRAEGLSYDDAAGRLFHYIQEARKKRITGVALKDPELTPALPQAEGNPQP